MNVLPETADRTLTAGDVAVQNGEGDGVAVKFSPIGTLKELAELLNFNLSSIQGSQASVSSEVLSLDRIRLELPRRIDSMDPSLFFQYDEGWRYCVFQYRIAHAVTPFTNYREWLARFRHCFEKMAKDGYVVYSINKREMVSGRWIAPLIDVGFDKSFLQNSCRVVVQSRESLFDNAQPWDHPDIRADFLRVCYHPAIANVYSAIQEFLFRDPADIFDWMMAFSHRKKFKYPYPGRVVGDNLETVFIQSAHPTFLPRYLGVLPRINYISVTYSMAFVAANVDYREVSIGTLASDLGIKNTAVSAIATYLSSSITERHRIDFQRICCSWFLPGQVMLNILPTNGSSKAMDGLSALCAKMFLSSSDGCRNIVTTSMEFVDNLIIRFLIWCGIAIAGVDGLRAVAGREEVIRLWNLVLSGPGGQGWLNHGVLANRNIQNPLYEGITTLPCYGGVTSFCTSAEDDAFCGVVSPPIYDAIVAALEATIRARGVSGSVITQLHAIKQIIQTNRTVWLCSLSMLNEHIRITGETGFRLPSERVYLVEAGGLGPGHNQNLYDRPIFSDVSIDSFAYLFRQPPKSFEPLERVERQPIMESGISAELQRLYSILLIIRDRVGEDGRDAEFTKNEIVKVVLESTESNHFSKGILKAAFSFGGSHLFNLNQIRQVSRDFDDFEALFYRDCSEVVLRHPELFGFTRQVVTQLAYVPVVSGEEYQRKAPEGIIGVNDVMDREGIHMLSYDDMRARLADCNLLSYIRNAPGKIILSEWIEYMEEMGFVWPEEVNAYDVTLPESQVAIYSCETIRFNKFVRFFQLAKKWTNYFEDSSLVGASNRRFWYCGLERYTMSYSEPEILRYFRCEVKSWKSNVSFANPLLISINAEHSV